MYDCGMDALRKLFLRIHPAWKNSTKDIKKFSRGHLRLEDWEESRFSSGDIEQWDITLLCKVLLFSEVSSAKLKTEEYKGCEQSVMKLRDIKNKLISHQNHPALTMKEYRDTMSDAESALKIIGLSTEQFRCAVEGADLTTENLHYKMYLEEVGRSIINKLEDVSKQVANHIDKGNEKLSNEVQYLTRKVNDLSDLIKAIQKREINQSEIPSHAARQDPLSWDEWLKVRSALNNLDADSNQYILVIDKESSSDADYLTALGKIPWKLVLDLDPDSDINGILSHISACDKNSSIIVSHTPSQLTDRVKDFKRVQWVFANGKNKDTEEDAPKEKFVDWRKRFRTPVSNLINNCADNLDPRKPVICLVLNLRNSSLEMAKTLLEEIDDRFSFKNYSLKFVLFCSEFDLEKFPNAIFSNLSTKFLFLGISAQLGQANDSFRLPTQQQDVLIPLGNKKYRYLSEYLDILYIGCENIPTELPEEEQEKFTNDHLKSFLCGNKISFESLHFGHDCARSLTNAVKNRITKIFSHGSTSQIVQISHSPGTGGSTIARRILWDLHNDYPCAIVKMPSYNDNVAQENDNEQFVGNLSERLGEIEDVCELKPVVLMDGNSRQVRNISDHLVRKLNADGRRAIILRLVYPQGNEKENDSYFQEKSNFTLQSVLEDDAHDLGKFRTTYDHYYQLFDHPERGRRQINELKRVFHFPMMAMLEPTKLKLIVQESLEILKRERPPEYEVAILVAFLQIYANRETPAGLIANYLRTEPSTSEPQKFSSDLLCLMIAKKACSKEKWIGRKNYENLYEDDSYDDDDVENDAVPNQGMEWYTFQHHNVAEIVIEHSKRQLDDITREFVELIPFKGPFKDLIYDLFLYKKGKPEDHFSHLVMQLENGGKIFEEAAEKAEDAAFYSHVARYFAIEEKPPNFEKARSLISKGLSVDKCVSKSKDKLRGVRDAEGHILLREMKATKAERIKSVENLEKYARETLKCFRKARDNPPMTYPNPLMGEVNVWQFCFDWVIRWKNGDVEGAVEYMTEEEFFKTAIADCFFLIDQIEKIVQSVPSLVNPAHTLMLANESRLNLMLVLGRTKGKTGRKANVQSLDIVRLCEEISKKNFKTANEQEITRLRVSWMMNQAGKNLSLLKEEDRPVLLRWLEKLVEVYKAYQYAESLMNVSTLQKKDPYTLEKAWGIVKKWQSVTPYDAFAYFYEYIICFLNVLSGSVFEYRSLYHDALETCVKKCEGNHRRYLKRYYIAAGRDIKTTSSLMSAAEFEKLYNKESSAKQRTNDSNPERKYLYECRGRVKLQKNHPRGKEYPYIALEQGNLKIGVERNALGKPHQDYTPYSRVTFLVYFTLDGPKARGIRFEKGEKVRSSIKLERQASKNIRGGN